MASGESFDGQCNVEAWSGVRQVAVGTNHTVGLLDDGRVIATGWNYNGMCDVDSWEGIVYIAAGPFHTVGLMEDGSVLVAGTTNINTYDISSIEKAALPTKEYFLTYEQEHQSEHIISIVGK